MKEELSLIITVTLYAPLLKVMVWRAVARVEGFACHHVSRRLILDIKNVSIMKKFPKISSDKFQHLGTNKRLVDSIRRTRCHFIWNF
jgi:hypothetical protein